MFVSMTVENRQKLSVNKMKCFQRELHLRRHCCDTNIIDYADMGAVIYRNCKQCDALHFKENGFSSRGQGEGEFDGPDVMKM